MGDIAWDTATWLNRPPKVRPDGNDLLVTTAPATDFWRTTGYGYVRDSGHALLTEFPVDSAVEVSYVAELDELYDQAGLLIRVSPSVWVKAGTELTDDATHVSTVVTNEVSDWSQAPVPDWSGREITIRASRAGDAVTIRARAADDPWRTIRLAPLPPDAAATAGPYCCSPERSGLTVRFTRYATGPADAALHSAP
jgi:regulation of enolase protein 1 (concanavalin A-like superfamily)